MLGSSGGSGGLQQTSNSFHWADYVVLALSLLLSCSVGIYFAFSGGRQKTTSEYLMGDRSMRLVPVSVSLVASFLSAILILGHPAEIYLSGVSFHFGLLGIMLAYLLAAVLFVNLLYPLKLTSSFEYLEKRFNSKLVRSIGTLLNLTTMTMYAGMAIFAPCTATEKVTNNAVRREYVIAVCGVVGTFYTLLGGIKAVVWVDAIQAGIMLAGTLAVAVKATLDAGGWQEMWRLNVENARLQWPPLSPDPRERHSLWGLSIGMAVYWLSALGVNQASVQRYSAMPSIQAARRTMLLGAAGHFLMVSTCTLVGLAIFGRYASVACDIHEAGWADKNQIVTYYVMERMNAPGFPGLFTAALFAAGLSSVSSALSSASTIAWTDLLRPYVCKQVSESTATIMAKCLVAAFGLASILIAYIVTQLGGTIMQVVTTFLGAASGPSLGLFLLGGVFPRANWFGASLGSMVGLACGVWIGAGAYATSKQHAVQLPSNITGCDFGSASSAANATTNTATTTTAATLVSSMLRLKNVSDNASEGFLPEYVYSISYVWTTGIGICITLLAGLAFSFLAERGKHFGFVEPTKVQESHLLPGVARLLSWLGYSEGVIVRDQGSKEADRDSQNSWPMLPAEISDRKVPIEIDSTQL